MFLNGNYAQYFPQGFTQPFAGAYGFGGPQFGAPGVVGGIPGAYGGDSGVGFAPVLGPQQQGFGQPGFGYPAAGPQSVMALIQLAQQVATHGLFIHQAGNSLTQLAQQIAMQLSGAQTPQYFSGGQGRYAPFFNSYAGFGANPGVSGFGIQGPPGQGLGTQGLGTQGFGLTPGQTPFSAGAPGVPGFAQQTPAAWGINRPAMAS